MMRGKEQSASSIAKRIIRKRWSENEAGTGVRYSQSRARIGNVKRDGDGPRRVENNICDELRKDDLRGIYVDRRSSVLLQSSEKIVARAKSINRAV